VSITGNQANKSNIGAPGCLDNVIAVGASWDAPNLVDPLGVHPNGTLSMPFDTQVCTQTGTTDTVACFSNSSPELDLLAPGVKTTELSSAGNAFLDSAGTSEAAPIVAGCIADMLEANPSLDTAGVRQILTSSPTVLTDPANARITPRLCSA
jgi:subtilisin family serine protease